MTPIRKVLISGLAVFMIGLGYGLAQSPSPDLPPGQNTKPRATMEIFGVGPEMFGDRGVAWAKNIGLFINECVSQFGITAAAVTLLVKNLSQKKKNDELEQKGEKRDERLDRQRDDINHIAAATGTTPPSQVPPCP